MDDIQMLREPGINRRIINAVRSERARIDVCKRAGHYIAFIE